MKCLGAFFGFQNQVPSNCTNRSNVSLLCCAIRSRGSPQKFSGDFGGKGSSHICWQWPWCWTWMSAESCECTAPALQPCIHGPAPSETHRALLWPALSPPGSPWDTGRGLISNQFINFCAGPQGSLCSATPEQLHRLWACRHWWVTLHGNIICRACFHFWQEKNERGTTKET